MKPLSKALSRKSLPILFFLILFFSSGFSQIRNIQWERISHSGIIVFHTKKDKKNAEQILSQLVNAYPQIASEIGGQSKDSIYVHLTPSELIYRKFVGEHFPRWSEGAAYSARNIIILKSPRFSTRRGNVHTTAIHELTHILLNNAVRGNPVPRWFNEGLAVYYSGEKMYTSGSLISKALISKSIISLEDIDKVLKFHKDKAHLAYQQSYLAVRYLFEQFGKAKVKQIIFLMGQGQNIDGAMSATIGMDFFDFEYDWYHHLQKKYRWHFLMDFDTYLWIFILLLFLFGFMIIRYRNRQTIKRWEIEDEMDDVW
ncbi:hypothetical protein B6I21_04770 [candidate division KSB1 bacterium 4572_119]|nr:MAG: hypothetical protein B6I21_04770 [candidate division KSB1 bacterium 4572_119]